MTLSEKLFDLIQAKYLENESISRSALVGLSAEVNADLLQLLVDNQDKRIKTSDGRIVPVILIARPEIEIVQAADQQWHVPGFDIGFETREEAAVEYRSRCQDGYAERGWGRGWQDFAVLVRNKPEAPVVYLATARGDLNASVDTATVTFGFLPTTNVGDGCGYFLTDDFFLGLLPRVDCDQAKEWPRDYVKHLKPVFEEISAPDHVWKLAKVMNLVADRNNKIPCRVLEAILGLPNSENARLKESMLKRQLALMVHLSEILASPEKSAFYERLRDELGSESHYVDQFEDYVLRRSAATSIEDCIYATYAGVARSLTTDSFVCEPWWEVFTVAILERVLTVQDPAAFKVDALNALVGDFPDKRQPLVAHNSMEFAFHMEGESPTVSVSRANKQLESGIPVSDTYVYQSDDKDTKSFKLTFEAFIGVAVKPPRATHDILMLDNALAGCFVTINDALLLRKAGAFQPSRSNAKHSFVSQIIATKDTNGMLQLFPGCHFELDKNSVVVKYEGSPSEEKLTVDEYDKYYGIRCDIRDGAEVLFSGKVNGKRCSYTVALQVDQKDDKSFQTEFKHLVECHLNNASPMAPVSFDSATVSSRLSQEHLTAVVDTETAVGYPLLIADDIAFFTNNVWLDSYTKATAKVFQTVDPRPDPQAWKQASQSIEAEKYFNVRKALFKALEDHKELGGSVFEEYSLYVIDKPENEVIRSLLEDYLTAYNAWLESDYANAIVTDTIWLYLTKSGSLGAKPDAILFPPQHPVRLYWQFQAQRYMRSMLTSGRASNIVASFDSHSIPDVVYMPMLNSTTGKTVLAAYFALPTSSDYWGVYHGYEPVITAEDIDESPFFTNWGFEITSIKRTMSAGEVESAINATQSVCIAKDALNVRYIAKNMGGASARLLLQQGVSFLNGKDDVGPKFGPRMVSIIGLQASRGQECITEAEIMRAREITSGRLQWFTESATEKNRLKVDVTIASLGAANISAHQMSEDPSFGVVSAGGLLRYRNRSRGVATASEIVESRLTNAAVDACAENADNIFLRTLELLEGRSFGVKNVPGHVRFNADLVGAGIMKPDDDSSHYYAISSSDVDQACFEALNGNAGVYLWEYRLPMPGAHSSGTDGFYLLAKENNTMIQAVSEAVKSLNPTGATDETIRKMLFVSAKRGIPTVKNLASGGKSALGEVGVLVTLNMLQGNLLQDATGGICPAYHCADGFEYFTIMVPMDVFRERFEALSRNVLGVKTPTRPDIVVFSIKCKNVNDNLKPLRMRLSFIEVKTRRDKMTASAMSEALSQADYFRQMYTMDDAELHRLSRWEKIDFLVGMLSFGFRVYESVGTLLKPLVRLYPQVVSALFEKSDFLEVNPQHRLTVVHAISESGLSMESNGVYQAIEISKADGYEMAIGGVVPFNISPVGTWGLLPKGEMLDEDGSDDEHVPSSNESGPSAEINHDSQPQPLLSSTEAAGAVTSTEAESEQHPTMPEETPSLVLEETPVDTEEKYQDILQSIKDAFEDFGIQTKRVAAPIETPNLVLIDYKGSKTCTEAKIVHSKKEFLSTYGVDLHRVESRKGVVRLVLKRDQRAILFMDEIWSKFGYDAAAAAEKGLLIAIQEDTGAPVYLNPQKEASPHALVAGMTGSGKSVLLLNMLYCLKDRFPQDAVKVYIMDPKKVDFMDFSDIPNFEVIPEKDKAVDIFSGLVAEMEKRYALFAQKKVKKVSQYNSLPDVEKLPIIWCFHDEFADWFLDEGYQANVGVSISSLSAKARAAGIYLVFAAQRPEAKVMPPFMRSNFGLRLVLKVSDPGTSTISLGDAKAFGQANELLGKGHMIVVLSETQAYCQVPNIKGLD